MIRSLVFVLFVLTACSQTPPTRFYTLTSLPAPPVDEGADEGLLLALAPIDLPAYLERPQFVTRLNETRMEIAEFDSWIEPLDTLIQRTLAADLQADPAIAQVIRLPQRRGVRFDFGVEITINQFETTAAGVAHIDADWVVVDANERLIVSNSYNSQVPVPSPQEFAQRSLALSALLDGLGVAILIGIEAES